MTDYTATIANLIIEAARRLRARRFHRTAAILQRLNLGLGKLTRREDLEAMSLRNLGRLARDAGSPDRARDYHAHALRLERKAGRTSGVIDNLTDLGWIAAEQQAWEEAREYHFEACETARALGEQEEVADQQSFLGDIAAAIEDTTTARDHYQQAHTLYAKLGLEENARDMATSIAKLDTKMVR